MSIKDLTNEAIQQQKKELDMWKAVLKPDVYNAMAKWCEHDSSKFPDPFPFEIIRGDEIDRWLKNYMSELHV